jgi:PAS domain S-box-containing protein
MQGLPSSASATSALSKEQVVFEMMERIPVGTFVLERKPDGCAAFTFVSSGLLAMLNADRDSVLADPDAIFHSVHPDEVADVLTRSARAFTNHTPFHWTGRAIVNGATRWFSAEASPRERDDGVTVWEGVVIDITSHKAAEEAVAQSARKMSVAALTAGVGFWEYDFKENRQHWDVAMLALFGLKEDEFTGVWDDYVHKDDLERVREDVLRSMAVGDRSEQEYRIKRPNGEIRHVSAICVAGRGPNGELLKLTGVCFDITERKLAEIKLKQSETRLARILDELPIPIGVCSTEEFGPILTSNKAFISTFGYSPEELPDVRAWSILAYPDEAFRNYVFERWNASIAHALDHGGIVGPLEYPVVCKDGSIRDIVFSGVIFDNIITVTAVDVTDRRNAERELTESAERERQADERRRLLLEKKLRTSLAAAAVAHEINQPLSTILMHTQLALATFDSAAAESDKLRTHLADMAAEGSRMVTTIEKMRSLLRNVQTTLEPVELSGVIHTALLYNKNLLSDHHIEVSLSGGPGHHFGDSPCRIAGDEAQLQVAIGNLIRNAVDAITTHAAPSRRIAIELIPMADSIHLVIGDSGPGLDDSLLDNIPLHTTKPQGSGVGLFIVATTIENHGGSFNIGRSPLGGAEFRLSFPRPSWGPHSRS